MLFDCEWYKKNLKMLKEYSEAVNRRTRQYNGQGKRVIGTYNIRYIITFSLSPSYRWQIKPLGVSHCLTSTHNMYYYCGYHHLSVYL